MSLHLLYEILMALAAIATVAGFVLEAVKEYRVKAQKVCSF